MKACKVDEQQLAKWIDGAKGEIWYLSPAITEKLAQKLLAAEKRTGQRNHVVIELNDEMDRSGYGQTDGVRTLYDEGATVHHRAGLRVAALTAPEIGVIWSPIAERIDPIECVSVNGIWMEGPEQRELQRWISRMIGGQARSEPAADHDGQEILAPGPQTTHESDTAPIEVVNLEQPDAAVKDRPQEQSVSEVVHYDPNDPNDPTPTEPDVEILDVDEEKLAQVETHLREHPPRDFREERQTEVYQGYVGFIEIHVTGASLSTATTLAIPKDLTELGLGNDLRDRLSERMRIDLSGSVDLGARDVNRRVDAFREIFTAQMGPPLGRIYKKSDWAIMETKWTEIEHLVETANAKIERCMHTAVQNIITDDAEDWAK